MENVRPSKDDILDADDKDVRGLSQRTPPLRLFVFVLPLWPDCMALMPRGAAGGDTLS